MQRSRLWYGSQLSDGKDILGNPISFQDGVNMVAGMVLGAIPFGDDLSHINKGKPKGKPISWLLEQANWTKPVQSDVEGFTVSFPIDPQSPSYAVPVARPPAGTVLPPLRNGVDPDKVVPGGQGFATKPFGQAVEDYFDDAIRPLFPDTAPIFNTANGKNGPDVAFDVVQYFLGLPIPAGELKPGSNSGYSRLKPQLSNWAASGKIKPGTSFLVFFYDPTGIIYLSSLWTRK